MQISFHGAARTVTGSKHLVHIGQNKQVLLDCGMFQGMGKDTIRLNKNWGFDPLEITYVIISHAHIDHIGLLPKLVKDGYKGPVFLTSASADLATVLLRDSARIQESDVAHLNKGLLNDGRTLIEPLYNEEDAAAAVDLFHRLEYNQPFDIDDDLRLQYTDCGHILGSAAIHLTILEEDTVHRLTFSGDVGRYNDAILRQPQPFPQSDYVILESTYGDTQHPLVSGAPNELLKHVLHTCIQKKGKLIIPAFSVGRTQEILYLLNRLSLENRLPALKYYVDSPLSIEATEIIKSHPECFNAEVQDMLKRDDDVFDFPGLEYVKDAQHSMAIDQSPEPCVIISASGMAEAGRVKHHIEHHIGGHQHTVLLVGYCDPNSLGGRLRDGAREVMIYGKPYEVKAEVEAIQSMSAHGDYDDLCRWMSCQDKNEVKELFLVHGEYDVQQKFRDRLLAKGYTSVHIPQQHEFVKF